ncbi:DNA-binding protein [Deltaproteobacteria bacterium Smac51]|nr:DNA-binding protein [Deltaproteobacteria bacterium Smac51]
MKAEVREIKAEGWVCGKCQEPLRQLPVEITYMGSSFQVELPRCPVCGFTFIPPDLAYGKMREVEKLLEDK